MRIFNLYFYYWITLDGNKSFDWTGEFTVLTGKIVGFGPGRG
jgi:hypothetical protein